MLRKEYAKRKVLEVAYGREDLVEDFCVLVSLVLDVLLGEFSVADLPLI